MKIILYIFVLITFLLIFGCVNSGGKDKIINDINNENIMLKYDLNIIKEKFNNMNLLLIEKDKNISLLLNTISNLNKDIVSKDNTISNLNTDVVSKDNTISNLNTDVVSKDNTISNLNTDVVSKDNTISNLNTTIVNKDNTISNLNTDVVSKDNTINSLNLSNQLLENKYNNALVEIDDLNSSFIRNYKYYLDGELKDFNILVYGRYNDYSNKLINWGQYYLSASFIETQSFLQTSIDDPIQQSELKQISIHFSNLSVDDKTKVRAIVSFVQNIDYFAGKDIRNTIGELYPYSVIYNGIGICGEKSRLLILLLKQMGYKTAYISIHDYGHAAVGIGCTSEFDYKDSGYCYIESTVPTIITDSNYWYVSRDTIDYDIYAISDGTIYDAIEDYNAQKYYHEYINTNISAWDEYKIFRKEWGLFNTDCPFTEILDEYGRCLENEN